MRTTRLRRPRAVVSRHDPLLLGAVRTTLISTLAALLAPGGDAVSPPAAAALFTVLAATVHLHRKG
ncbi:hypothetical protein [Streptomyces sp. NPDC002825]|uniref:hypothetical protein n=1 Tax=Streptomyces sp. NPDC002825 TaxID=3154666 RepID=UPI00332FA8C3